MRLESWKRKKIWDCFPFSSFAKRMKTCEKQAQKKVDFPLLTIYLGNEMLFFVYSAVNSSRFAMKALLRHKSLWFLQALWLSQWNSDEIVDGLDKKQARSNHHGAYRYS